MEAVLKQQSDTMKRLEELSKQDRLLQLAQVGYEKKLDDDETKHSTEQLKELKKMNTTLEKTNSNVIKLNTSFQRATAPAKSSKNKDVFSAEGVDKVSSATEKMRDYRGLKERIRDKVLGRDSYDQESLRYKFTTARGFLDTVGLVNKDSKGIFGDILAKREEKKRYIDDAIALNPQMKNLKQYGGDESKVREHFANQFDLSASKQKELRAVNDRIEGMKSRGLSEEEIARTVGGKKLFAQKAQLATVIGNTDFRFKGLSKAEAAEPSAHIKDNVVKFPKIGPIGADGLGNSEENAIEQNKLIAQQTDLLVKIEENTRKDLNPPHKKDEEPKGGFLSGLLDALSSLGKTILSLATSVGGKLLGGAKAVGSAAIGAGKSVLGKLGGPMGKVLGPVAAVAGGLYEGYTAWNDADEKVKRGEITEREGTVLKGGAVGKGVGTAGGALAGGKLGAMIGTMILPGVGTAVGGIIGGIVGGLAGGKFGDEVGKFVTDGALKIKDGLDEYLIKPLGEMFDKVTGVFKEYIIEPLAEFFSPLTEFFKGVKDSVMGVIENIGIPEIGFTIPVINKKVAIGPFYPFKKEATQTAKPEAMAPGNSDAGAGRGSSEAAAVDPRRLDSKSLESAKDPNAGNTLNKASANNDQLRTEATRPVSGGNTVVSAPTVNNVNNTTQTVRMLPRNRDNSLSSYLSSRYA